MHRSRSRRSGAKGLDKYILKEQVVTRQTYEARQHRHRAEMAKIELIDGMQSDAYLPPSGDASNDWIALFRKIHGQYIPKLPFDGNVEYGMGLAYTFVEALQRAGANPTRQSIVQTIETQKLTGPGLVPFRYSKDSHAGYTGAQIAEIKNGETTVTGKPLTTDDGGGDITESTASPTPAPANGIPPSS